MLVLTRREGEQIVIAGNIRISIVQIKGSAVRIGIEAPREIPVARVELEKKLEQVAPAQK